MSLVYCRLNPKMEGPLVCAVSGEADWHGSSTPHFQKKLSTSHLEHQSLMDKFFAK
jgi:hypothetical protein